MQENPLRASGPEVQVKIREAGVSHGEVTRRNFVRAPKGIRLIDFDGASRHECPPVQHVPRDAVSAERTGVG